MIQKSSVDSQDVATEDVAVEDVVGLSIMAGFRGKPPHKLLAGCGVGGGSGGKFTGWTGWEADI